MATKAERIAERVATEVNVWAKSSLATVVTPTNGDVATSISFVGDGYTAEQLIITVRPALGGRVDTATRITYYPTVGSKARTITRSKARTIIAMMEDTAARTEARKAAHANWSPEALAAREAAEQPVREGFRAASKRPERDAWFREIAVLNATREGGYLVTDAIRLADASDLTPLSEGYFGYARFALTLPPATPDERAAREAAVPVNHGSHRCQALKFEGDRCTGRITHTSTTGEWMTILPWTRAQWDEDGTDIDFEDIVTVDGRVFDRGPDSELMVGDMIFINVVVRAWCTECVEEECKVTHWTSLPRFAELTPGDRIPNGTSRYCVNGYNEDACDYGCSTEDHTFRALVEPVVKTALAANIRTAIGLKF